MNIKRESVYLTALAGVAFTSIGLMFIMNNTAYAEMPSNYQFAIIWLAVGTLYMWSGIFDLFDGIQGILEDYRAKQNEKKEGTYEDAL